MYKNSLKFAIDLLKPQGRQVHANFQPEKIDYFLCKNETQSRILNCATFPMRTPDAFLTDRKCII